MALFTSILISVVASVVGVQADMTLWKTETAWSTMAANTVWNTVWNTQTYTETAWSTYVPPAVTISVPYTVTSVLEKDYTNILSIPYTVTSVVEKDYTTTLTKVVVGTVTQECTPVTVNQPTTITIPTTVTVFTTSSVTGLVTCPTRVINPTYTTSMPLPDNYTWGCPPGTICKPPQIGCNFEQNPPADSYYCSPDECVSIQPPPPFTPTSAGGGTCGPYPTPSGYFNFDPEYFGLSYSIFVDGGDYADTCAGCAMTTLMPVSQISDGQPQAPTVVSVCEPISTLALVSTISDGQPQGPVVTTAARLARRADQVLPSQCFQPCNECLKVAEGNGKVLKLCPSLTAAYGDCTACISIHQGATQTVAGAVLQSIDPFTNYCNAFAKVGGQSSPLLATVSSATTVPATTPTSTPQKPSPTTSSPPKISPISPTSSSPPPPPTTSSPTTVTTESPGATSVTCAVSQISDGQPQECTSVVSTSTAALATFSGAAGHTLSPPSIFWSSPMGWALLLLVNALPI